VARILGNGDDQIMMTDATFKVACKPFTQLLNVMVVYKTRNIPVFHVLMEGKDRRLYLEIFRKIKEAYPAWDVKMCMTDFEAGLAFALRMVYPEARLFGCRFHFSQAVFRKIQGECDT